MQNELVVLIVDDHPPLRNTISTFIESLPAVRVLATGDFGRAAVWIDAEERIGLVVANVWLKGDLNGLHVAELATQNHPQAAVLMMSTNERASILGLPSCYALVQMPFGVEAMMTHVDDAFVRRHESLALVR